MKNKYKSEIYKGKGEIEVLVMGTDTDFVECPNCSIKTKQETIEEVAEIFVSNRFSKQISGDETYPDIYASKEAIVESHILFAKWQQERSCEHNYILTAEQGHRIIKCLKCNNIQPI